MSQYDEVIPPSLSCILIKTLILFVRTSFLNDNKDIHFAYLPEFISFNLQHEYISVQPWYYDAQWYPEHEKSLEEVSRRDDMASQ